MDRSVIPGWFAALFAAVLLCAAGVTAWCCVARSDLRFRIDDTLQSLNVSRGREAKQTYEYHQAAAAIPLTQEALAAAQPESVAAQAAVIEQKALRKELRTVIKESETALETAAAAAEAMATEKETLLARLQAAGAALQNAK